MGKECSTVVCLIKKSQKAVGKLVWRLLICFSQITVVPKKFLNADKGKSSMIDSWARSRADCCIMPLPYWSKTCYFRQVAMALSLSTPEVSWARSTALEAQQRYFWANSKGPRIPGFGKIILLQPAPIEVSHKSRGQNINTNFVCTKFFDDLSGHRDVRTENHGRPHRAPPVVGRYCWPLGIQAEGSGMSEGNPDQKVHVCVVGFHTNRLTSREREHCFFCSIWAISSRGFSVVRYLGTRPLFPIQGIRLGILEGSARYLCWTGQGSARKHDCNMGFGKKRALQIHGI